MGPVLPGQDCEISKLFRLYQKYTKVSGQKRGQNLKFQVTEGITGKSATFLAWIFRLPSR